jgi:UrcA family protein
MHSLNLKFAGLGALAALAVATGTLAATSAPLHAAELVVTAKAPQARIAYGDLNLRSEAGVARLEARVRAAADRLCTGIGIEALAARVAEGRCRTATVAAAAPQVKKAIDSFASRYAAASVPSAGGE